MCTKYVQDSKPKSEYDLHFRTPRNYLNTPVNRQTNYLHKLISSRKKCTASSYVKYYNRRMTTLVHFKFINVNYVLNVTRYLHTFITEIVCTRHNFRGNQILEQYYIVI